MTKGAPVPPIPDDAPRAGEVYKHYKGDTYKVVGLALHSNEDVWMVVYEPMHENPDAALFTRPLKDWREVVEWKGEKVERFQILPLP
ncbi:DUF1653 domain-containing protein [Acetobacteraceae bacterium]|nr:DUF1653 domain-containing protein [Candidatus Parcubacteria bacterium]